MARLEAVKKNKIPDGDLEGFRFLHEIEALSRALALDPNPLRSRPNLNPSPEKPFAHSSSSSLWSWKPLSKALYHLRHPRRHRHRLLLICFSLRVHSVEHLPPPLASAALRVYWTAAAAAPATHTRTARAVRGAVQFEDTLAHRTTLRATVSGPRRPVKYEPRPFVLWASAAGAPTLDLGRHEIDLTRLLPLTLEELDRERSSGRWSTSFRLSGIARGAVLNVSFGYSVVGEGLSAEPGCVDQKISEILDQSVGTLINRGDQSTVLKRIGSVPGSKHVGRVGAHSPSLSVEEVKVLHEVIPSSRPDVLNFSGDGAQCDSKLDGAYAVDFKEKFEDTLPRSKSLTLMQPTKGNEEMSNDEPEFVVIDKGVEIATRNQLDAPKFVEHEGFDDKVETVSQVFEEKPVQPQEELSICNSDAGGSSLLPGDSSTEEVGDAFHSFTILEAEELETPKLKANASQALSYIDMKSNYVISRTESRCFSFDDITESVANEFLSMLGMESSTSGSSYYSDQESPNELIWERFEKEYVGENFSDNFELSPIVQSAELEHLKAVQTVESKSRAKMLEEAEAEALMRRWGLDEKAFESSLPTSRSGFGSPIELSP